MPLTNLFTKFQLKIFYPKIMSHNAIWIITNGMMAINGKLAVILYRVKAYLVDVKKIDIGFKDICAYHDGEFTNLSKE